ncbi:hypothetical protein COV04_04060 [Candidatus Uhrbacteria bacterium CG10_big_fil_rev_8_21_14_0_10_48_11]|uniref:Uncharacterized protein n=1 Tax=Candidatus Uhrbacteria bacterium CG10_big_fil_rev_8_21_14_0_10_48_11 TaxID=1975037 RepID=A0A2M8LDQ2_9BACT|nr:MAG: hypothetical protein COV04_04060 [Candidatus Uhrbacteria bacterium CG10_big_fil_rev_8_21_14_0_10_48_11]
MNLRELSTTCTDPAGVDAESFLDRTTPAVQERLLWLAVLRDAIEDFQKYLITNEPVQQIVHREVTRWISSETEEPCSFNWVCDVLGLSASYVRGGLFAWRYRVFLARQRGRSKAAVSDEFCHRCGFSERTSVILVDGS